MKITSTLKLALKKVLNLQFGEVNTDKGMLLWDGEEDLKEGDEVFIQSEDSDEPIAAPDGEYITEDGKTISIVEGKVASIKDPESEVAPEEPAEIEAEDEEPAEEPADEEPAEENSLEDRVAALEARLAEFTDGLNAIINSIAGLEERLAEAEAKLASVEAPAADPIDEKPTEEEMKRTRLSYMRKK